MRRREPVEAKGEVDWLIDLLIRWYLGLPESLRLRRLFIRGTWEAAWKYGMFAR
jgi:hypothetical protein